MLKNDRCKIPGIGTGTVTNVRYDTNGVPIYDIVLDDSEATPTGTYIARAEEFSFDSPLPAKSEV